MQLNERLIVSLSNAAAILPLRKAMQRGDHVTAGLAFASGTASFAYHWMDDNNDDTIRLGLFPISLTIDRIFAIAHGIRLFVVYGINRAPHAIAIASVACCTGLWSELERGTSLYPPLHSLWHILIFATCAVTIH